MRNKLGSFVFALVAITIWSYCPAHAADPRRPNIVLIVADDLGWADLGCYGSKFHKTPHIDKLAATGVRFTDAYAACPVCSPTRAALMTGKHPARLHITDWLPGKGDVPANRMARPDFRRELPLEETTIAEILKAAGYATVHIGKWHLGGDGFGPEKQGYDINIAGDHTGTPLSYVAPFKRGMQTMQGLETAPAGEYLTDRLTNETTKFITANKDRPFFVSLMHYAPHTPLTAKPEVLAKYPGKATLGKQSNPIYAAMLESLDDGVGKIMQTLDDLKLRNNTIIIFTSDNGGLATVEGPNTPPTINAPLREGKGHLYEGGIRIPLIVAGAGVPKPAVAAAQSVSMDLLPTFCELCDLPVPKGLDGVSIVGALKGEALPKRELYWHYPHYSNQTARPGGAIIDGNFKLIEFYDQDRRELFDLKANIGESKNLAGERPEVVKRLADKLAAWRTSAGAQMMTPNTAYHPHAPAADGSILLPAKGADVTGLQLRYEPLPHKNCLGFWTRIEDTAVWELTIANAGKFKVTIHQGCGAGQGGSSVELVSAGQTLPFTVEDTGGFQVFKPRDVGTLLFEKPGRYTLTLVPKKKAKAAVMDVQKIVLTSN